MFEEVLGFTYAVQSSPSHSIGTTAKARDFAGICHSYTGAFLETVYLSKIKILKQFKDVELTCNGTCRPGRHFNMEFPAH